MQVCWSKYVQEREGREGWMRHGEGRDMGGDQQNGPRRGAGLVVLACTVPYPPSCWVYSLLKFHTVLLAQHCQNHYKESGSVNPSFVPYIIPCDFGGIIGWSLVFISMTYVILDFYIHVFMNVFMWTSACHLDFCRTSVFIIGSSLYSSEWLLKSVVPCVVCLCSCGRPTATSRISWSKIKRIYVILSSTWQGGHDTCKHMPQWLWCHRITLPGADPHGYQKLNLDSMSRVSGTIIRMKSLCACFIAHPEINELVMSNLFPSANKMPANPIIPFSIWVRPVMTLYSLRFLTDVRWEEGQVPFSSLAIANLDLWMVQNHTLFKWDGQASLLHSIH